MDGNPNEIELLFKAVCSGDLATVREFIQLIDVNEKDQFGASMLHHAAASRNPSISRCLLENNAEPNCMDKRQWTPLHTACSNSNLEVILVLIEYKADATAVTSSGSTPLHFFVRCAETTVVQHSLYFQCLSTLVRMSSITAVTTQGEMPLHFSAMKGSSESVRLLIIAGAEKGIDIDCVNNQGETPLHYAIRRGASDIVACLLQLGASLEISGNQGNAQQIAVKENQHRIMDILNNNALERRTAENADRLSTDVDEVLDYYGFPIESTNTHFFDEFAAYYLVYRDNRRKAWRKFLGQRELADKVCKGSVKVRDLCRKGIAKEDRGDIWVRIVKAKIGSPPAGYYERLLDKTVFSFERDIEKDVDRTFPNHTFFCSESAKNSVRRVLLAYSIRNPSVGYCQSMNFIVGILLLHMAEDEAFWVLKFVVEDLLEDYFVSSMIGLSVDQKVLESIVSDDLPKLYEHLEALSFPLTIFTTRWMMCIFLNTLPTESAMRLWDCIFFEGPRMLIFACFTLLKMNERLILSSRNTHELMTVLDSITSHAFEMNEIIDETLKQFNLLSENDLLERRLRYWTVVSKERDMKIEQVMFMQQDRTYYSKLDTTEEVVTY